MSKLWQRICPWTRAYGNLYDERPELVEGSRAERRPFEMNIEDHATHLVRWVRWVQHLKRNSRAMNTFRPTPRPARPLASAVFLGILVLGLALIHHGQANAEDSPQPGRTIDSDGTAKEVWVLAQAGGPCPTNAPTGIEAWLVNGASAMYAQAQRANGEERTKLLNEVVDSVDALARTYPNSQLACQARQPQAVVNGIPLAQLRAELSRASNAITCPALTEGARAIAKELLSAYKGERQTIDLVAAYADEALLAWGAYGESEALDLLTERGWRSVRSETASTNPLVGDVFATLFVSSSGQHVLSYRGTGTGGDVVTDLTILPSEQVTEAAKMAIRIKNEFPNVIFVGHSMGGRFAQLARVLTGNTAVAFNSAPAGLPDGVIRSFVAPGAPHSGTVFMHFRHARDAVSAINSAQNIVVKNAISSDFSLAPTTHILGPQLRAALSIATNFITQKDVHHNMQFLANAMQATRIAKEAKWIEAYDCTQEKMLANINAAPKIPSASNSDGAIANSTKPTIEQAAAKPPPNANKAVDTMTAATGGSNDIDKASPQSLEPNPSEQTLWKLDPKITNALQNVMSQFPSITKPFCQSLHGPLPPDIRKTLFEDSLLTIWEYKKQYQQPVDESMLQGDRFCYRGSTHCAIAQPRIYYCSSGESDFFTSDGKASFETSYPKVPSKVIEHVRKPMGDASGRNIPIEGTNCTIKAPWPDPNTAKWAGVCSNGKLSGTGTIHWMKGSTTLWQTQVGPEWGVSIKNNALAFDLDLTRFQFSLSSCQPKTSYRKALIFANSGVKRDVFENRWIVEELLSRGVDFLQERCSAGKPNLSNISVSIRTNTREPIYSDVVRARNNSKDSLSWQEFRNSASNDLSSRLTQQECARSNKEMQLAREQQSRNIEIQRREIEGKWNAYWGRIIAEESPWPNIADLMNYNKALTISKLADGHPIKLTVKDVAFENGHAYLIDRQVFTDIFANLPKGDFSWNKFAEGLQKSSDIGGYVIRCLVSANSLERFKNGNSYALEARLLSVAKHGAFLMDKIDLDCRDQ